jgi:DNA polymerase III delta prime subunit
MAPWLDWIGRRSRLLVLALTGLAVAEYRTHQLLIVNLATVGAFLVALWFSLPTRYVIQGEVDGAARRLRRLARKNWRDRRFVLMGESDSAAVTYVRQQSLEAGMVSCGWEEGDVTDIYENYKAIRSGKLLILGPPGSGKTLAALTLVTEILSFGLEAPNEWMLPIPVSIGGWDGTQELGEWLSDRLVEGYRIARPVARALVYGDYILPVLDGLDEADDQSHDRITTSQKILEQIRSSSDASDIAHGALVMTCRSDFYRNLFDSGHSLRNAAVVEMKDLEPEAIRTYLRMRFKDDQAHDPCRSDPFASAVQQDDSCLVRALAKPLILTLAILVLKAEHSTPRQLARYKKESSLTNHLFRMLIPSAVRSNPRSPLPRIVGGVRKRALPWWRSSPSHYNSDYVRRWLLNIATVQRRGRPRPVEIHPGSLWRLAGEKTVKKIHTIVGLIFGLAVAGLASELVSGQVGYVVTAATAAVAIVFALWAGMLRRPESRSLSFTQFATPMGLLRLIVIAILGGLCALGGALDGGWRTAITSGVGGTIAFVVVIGLIGGIAEVVDPRWILRNDLLFGVLFGLGVSIAAALPGGLTGGIATSLTLNKYLSVPGSACLAIFIAIPAGIVLGSRCWTRHAFMVLLLAPKGRVPWRTMRFIKWCYLANLLKISGAGYELRHQEFVQALEPRIMQIHVPCRTQPIPITWPQSSVDWMMACGL